MSFLLKCCAIGALTVTLLIFPGRNNRLYADIVLLDDTNSFSYASTARGTYVHTPDSIYYIPRFSFFTDAAWLITNAAITSFIENLDVYFLILAYLRHGVSPLTIGEATFNQKMADYVILFSYLIGIFIEIMFFANGPEAIKVAFEPFNPLFEKQFAEAGGHFECSGVFTGNALFDHQVRMTLLRPKEYNYTVSTTPVSQSPPDLPFFDYGYQPMPYDTPRASATPDLTQWQATDYGYSRSLISLAPTPFFYSRELDTDLPSGRILQAINLMDRSNGDELFFGKSPGGDYFLIIQSGLSQNFTFISLESSEVFNYPHKDQSDPDAQELAMEPIAFLFSDAGSQWFLDAMHCYYMNTCLNGRLQSTSKEGISNNATVFSDDGPALDFLIYQSFVDVTQLPSAKKHKKLYVQPFNCEGTLRRNCRTSLFWTQEDKSSFPSVIRVVEGQDEIMQLYSDLKQANSPEIHQQLFSGSPYGYTHPHSLRSLMMMVLVQPAANPFRSIFRKLHRHLLVKSFSMLLQPSSLTPVMAVVPAVTGSAGLKRDLLSGNSLAPLKPEPGPQLLANIKAQAYYGEMLQNNWMALLYAKFRGHSYVEKARLHLFGYRTDPGCYVTEPERRRGMLWLAYGVTKMDKPSIQMLLNLNEHEHFISLSPAVSNALKLALKPQQIVAGRKGRSGRYSLWRNQLDRAYQAEHKAAPVPVSYRHKELHDIPETWKDEEFINALKTVEEDLSWQTKPVHQDAAGNTASTQTAKGGKGAFRRHFGSSPVTTAPSSQATASAGTVNNRLSIQNRDQYLKEIKGKIGRHQWVNKIFTHLENKKWARAQEWLIEGKTVQWKKQDYPLYHKSMGEDLANNEGQSATLFFVRQENQAIIVAAGAHPKATAQNKQIGKKYRILWVRDGFNDEELKMGKIYTLH